MSVHVVPLPAGLPRDEQERIVHEVWEAARVAIRECFIDWDALSLVFTPDLTPAEQTALAALIAACRSPITPAEYDAIRADLQALRDLRQIGRNAFMQLTVDERFRRLYDAQTATTKVLLALIRE